MLILVFCCFLEGSNVNPCSVCLFLKDLILIHVLCNFFWKELILILVSYGFLVMFIRVLCGFSGRT